MQRTKTTSKLWALILSLIMLLTLIPLSAFTFSATASAAGTTHVLNASELQNFNNKGDIPEGKTFEVDNGYFTIYCGKEARFDKSEKSFDDGFAGTQRINFNGGIDATTPANCIGFKTSDAATVKVWWVANDAGREIAIQDASGKEVDITKAGLAKGGITISTLKVPAAGKYFLGGTPKSNYIFKIEVTEEAASKEYVLEATADVKPAAQGTYKDGDSVKAGTESFFTLYNSAKTKYDSSKKDFNDGYSSDTRINFGGAADTGTPKNVIGFKADSAGTVKVWWASNGADRLMSLFDSNGKVVESAPGIEKNANTISTFKIPAAGTYYIGSTVNGGYLFKVAVTTGGAPVVRGDWSAVKSPAISALFVDGGTMTAKVNANVGNDGGDAVVVKMLDSKGNELESRQSVAEKSDHSLDFKPTASGDYTFTVSLEREGETAKVGPNVTKSFVLPLEAPVITSATSKGDGKVELIWQPVDEATGYKVYVDGKEVGTSAVTKYMASGLTVGKKYSFTVAATRAGEVGPASAAVSATATKDSKQTWGFVFYGTSTNAANNYYEGNLVEDGKVKIVSNGGKGKFQEGSNDGLAFYYTAIPTTQNFTLRAKVHIDTWTLSSGQEGFGVMALDSLPTDTANKSDVFWSNSYRVGAQRIAYRYDSTTGEVVYDGTGDKYQMNIGVGVQTKLGMTKANIDDVYKAAAGIVEFGEYPLETLATKKNAAGTYCTIGNCTNPATFKNPAVAELTDFIFELRRNNTGYFLSYYTPDGKLVSTQKFYDPKALDQLDPDNVYVGFAAARNMEATVSDVTLTTIDPKDDDPAEPKPKEKVRTNVTIKSAEVANSENYTLTISSTVKGTAEVSVNGAAATTFEVKTPGELTDASVKIADGSNKISVKFTPDAKQDLGADKELASTAPVTAEITVAFNNYFSEQNNLYVSPNGTKYGNGGPQYPLDLYTAVAVAQPGQTIVLMEGTYKLNSTLTIERGIDGTKAEPIKMVADPNAKTRPVIDLQKKAGIVAVGNYWYFSGFDVTKSADGTPAILVAGSNCTYDDINAYKNGDCGIYIRSKGNSADPKSLWPHDNLILNCTSYDNADATGENADGFAAKFTVGTGNVFDGCVAYNNCDDGWDLYARGMSIEPVTIRNCVAYRNGENLDGTIKGNGNGFKLGGESMPGAHVIENSIAFENKANGITCNSCPDIKIKNCTSYKNGGSNISLYTQNAAISTDFEAKGVISYKGSAADELKPQGTQDKTKYDNATNHYNGTGVTDDWFKSLTFKGVARKADGTIDMQGYLELTDKAAKDAGARMTGTKSGMVTITPDEELPNPTTGTAALPITAAVLAIAGAAVFVISKKRKH